MNSMATVECCVCGILFSFSHKLMKQRKGTEGAVWCPNGHRILMAPEKEAGKR